MCVYILVTTTGSFSQGRLCYLCILQISFLEAEQYILSKLLLLGFQNVCFSVLKQKGNVKNRLLKKHTRLS